MQKRIDLYIEGQKIDMFKDESLSITEVMKDIKDPSKIFTSFSKRFTLPASKTNNKVFKHYYRSYIDNTIDGRAYLNAELKLNGVTYRVGNLELMNVGMSNNNPDNYKVVFYGNTTELAKQLKNDELTDLDLSAYNHSDTAANIFSTFRNATDSSVIKYPLISKEDRFVWEPSDATYAVGTDNMKNIAFVDATRRIGDYGLTTEDLAPAMKISAILTAIENKYNFTFDSNSALNQQYIQDLHILLYRKQIETAEDVETTASANFTNFGMATVNNGIILGENITINSTGFGNGLYHYLDIATASSGTDPYTVTVFKNGVDFHNYTIATPSGTYQETNILLDTAAVYTIQIDSTIGSSFTSSIDLEEGVVGMGSSSVNSTGSLTLSGTGGLVLIDNLLPKMKIVDFLSSLFKMFNLVASIDKDNVILVESYDKFQSQYVERDITRYIDQSGFDIAKTNIFSAINFEFKEPKLQLTKAFSQFTKRNYGSQEYAPTISNNRITGSDYSVSIPLQMPVSESIPNLDYPNSGSTDAGVNYLQLVNESGKQTDIAPYLFYPLRTGSGVGQNSRDIAFDVVTSVVSVPTCYVPSNVNRRYNSTDLVWEYLNNLSFQDEIAIWDSISVIDKNLFNMFYKTFIVQSFNAKSRLWNVKAKLSEGFLHNLKLSDILIYNDNKFRINKIKSNFTTGISDLELISVTDDMLTELSVNAVELCAVTDTKIGYIDVDGNPEVEFIAAGTCETFNIIGNIKSSSGDFTAEILDAEKIWNLTTLKWDTNINTYNA
tara:strand:+ start:362 stop:2692 length:2331 start_codon:yes stop_codon:yes gene_type:complete